jgi:hypothetical protein
MGVDPRLLQIGIELAPTFIVLLRQMFTKANPTAPVPTDAELIATAEATFSSDHARNIEILRSHPAEPPKPAA